VSNKKVFVIVFGPEFESIEEAADYWKSLEYFEPVREKMRVLELNPDLNRTPTGDIEHKKSIVDRFLKSSHPDYQRYEGAISTLMSLKESIERDLPEFPSPASLNQMEDRKKLKRKAIESIEFFDMKDIERDNIIYWLNKITGLNYNLSRSEADNNASPMILYLGDMVIMRQLDWRKGEK